MDYNPSYVTEHCMASVHGLEIDRKLKRLGEIDRWCGVTFGAQRDLPVHSATQRIIFALA